MKIKDISIIVPPDDSFTGINSVIPSLGIAVLSGYLSRRGFEHGIVDFGRRVWREPRLRDLMPRCNDTGGGLRFGGG